MKVRSFFALAALTFSPSAFGQELEASASASTTGPAAAPAIGKSDGFASPNGQLGAGLSLSRPSGSRAYGELAFYTMGESEEASEGGFSSEASYRIWSISAILGGGHKISPELELEALLPLSFFSYNFSYSFDGPGTEFDEEESDGFSEIGVGNLQVGVNYLRTEGPVRMKIGGAVQWGPWTIDPEAEFGLAVASGYPARSGHERGLWAPETLSIVTPSHFEFGDQFVGTGDASIGLHLPTDGGDAELGVQLDPGFGYWAAPTTVVGARLPFVWFPTESGSDATFLAFEPYVRHHLNETAFANARFTLNIDEPLGFSFDEGKIWSLHLGGGGTF